MSPLRLRNAQKTPKIQRFAQSIQARSPHVFFNQASPTHLGVPTAQMPDGSREVVIVTVQASNLNGGKAFHFTQRYHTPNEYHDENFLLPTMDNEQVEAIKQLLNAQHRLPKTSQAILSPTRFVVPRSGFKERYPSQRDVMVGYSATEIAAAANLKHLSNKWHWAHLISHAEEHGMLLSVPSEQLDAYFAAGKITAAEYQAQKDILAQKRDMSQQGHNLVATPASGNEQMSYWMEAPIQAFVKTHGLRLEKEVTSELLNPKLHIAKSVTMKLSATHSTQQLVVTINFFPVCAAKHQYAKWMTSILEATFLPKSNVKQPIIHSMTRTLPPKNKPLSKSLPLRRKLF